MERTLAIIKPDAVAAGLIGRIIQRIEDAGIKIIAMRMEHLTQTNFVSIFIKPFQWRMSE